MSEKKDEDSLKNPQEPVNIMENKTSESTRKKTLN